MVEMADECRILAGKPLETWSLGREWAKMAGKY
jgi:hypothetical protein